MPGVAGYGVGMPCPRCGGDGNNYPCLCPTPLASSPSRSETKTTPIPEQEPEMATVRYTKLYENIAAIAVTFTTTHARAFARLQELNDGWIGAIREIVGWGEILTIVKPSLMDDWYDVVDKYCDQLDRLVKRYGTPLPEVVLRAAEQSVGQVVGVGSTAAAWASDLPTPSLKQYVTPSVEDEPGVRYPDGSRIYLVGGGRVKAHWADGTPLRGEVNGVEVDRIFNTVTEAADILRAAGQGLASVNHTGVQAIDAELTWPAQADLSDPAGPEWVVPGKVPLSEAVPFELSFLDGSYVYQFVHSDGTHSGFRAIRRNGRYVSDASGVVLNFGDRATAVNALQALGEGPGSRPPPKAVTRDSGLSAAQPSDRATRQPYQTLYSIEAHDAHGGPVGLRIEGLARNLDGFVGRELYDGAAAYANSVMGVLQRHSSRTSDGNRDRRDRNIQRLLRCFPGPGLHYRELEKDNWEQPWLCVMTEFGPVVIGKRHEVIVIDWSETVIIQWAMTLFPNSPDICDKCSIHAADYTKATEYLRVLLNIKPRTEHVEAPGNAGT